MCQVGTQCRWTHKIVGKEVQMSVLASSVVLVILEVYDYFPLIDHNYSVETVQDTLYIRSMTLYTYGDPTVFGRLNTFRHA